MTKNIIKSAAEAPAELLEKAIDTTKKVSRHIKKSKLFNKQSSYWHKLGSGLISGAAGDDPSAITTYSQVGSQSGFSLLWLVSFTFPIAAIVQEMCGRIGIVTGRGLAANIRTHFPHWVLDLCVLLLFMANTFTIGADLGAMVKAVQLLLPNWNFIILLISFLIIILGLQIFMSYKRYSKYLKWLSLALLAYIGSALLAHLNWGSIFTHTVIPQISFNKDQLLLVCATLGATISPCLFFWQTSQEIEGEIADGETTIVQRQVTTKNQIHNMRIDIWSGIFFSNLIMFFIIATCGGTLFPNGITNITSSAQAAEALRPFAGNFAYCLFAIGIVGAGLLSIPVLAGSSAYAMAESFKWHEGLNKKLKQAYSFYGIIIISMLIGLLINFIGLNPIKMLIYSSIISGIVAPLLIAPIILISSNHKIMGQWSNKKLTKIIGWLIIAVMVIAAILAIVLML
jgi:NRAMP (natural resistance-associated macrophage protein)-like metal ion transporter